jgi:hypothetical protein
MGKALSVLKRLVLPAIALIIVIGVVALLSRQKAPVVIETLPKDGAADVITTSQLLVKFGREIKEQEQNRLAIEIEPRQEMSLVWVKDQVNLLPKESLQPGTQYLVVIRYSGKEIYKFSFNTILFTADQIQREGALQSQDDLLFGEAYKDFALKYPWYLSLPIETTEYRIVYDFEQGSFRIRLKLAPEDESVKESLVQKALELLKRIGVPEPINYYVVPSE